MKKMNHILRNVLLTALAACTLGSCKKTSDDETAASAERYFEAWREIHYPNAVKKGGIYIIEDKAGTGMEWMESLPVTFLTYTMRELDGTVTHNSDEAWARQLGTWNQTYYYGPQVAMVGEGLSYAGLDDLLDGMRQGGTRTAIIPSWMMTYERYDNLDDYVKHPTDVTATIYTIKFLGQTENLQDYEFREMKAYAKEQWNVTDTLSTAAVFFKSHSDFGKEEPEAMPNDTTVYINYIGRRISDGQVFDTNIADTAKFYHIYNASRTYEPISVSWAEKPADIKMNGSTVVGGFGHGLAAMHPGESASFVFGYNLGYGSSGGKDTNMIPPYAALRFDVDLVPKP
ncbi:MAG: FKBP-type peptidyl-prolyl cis-trans isomerase [Bacteroidales bacterium]|jgi:FKBP-type peptidyl-prolyl cis-trans isomerase|nr:FKBP-type peptidyl-prolyl cis-trans isomerase [Bacteroidales bacterium]